MLGFLYEDDFPRIMDRFRAHPDIEYISTNISYGYFLSDLSILDLIETELVVWPAIMCQNLAGPTLWHLRCCVRAGIAKEDVEKIQQCIEGIAAWAGKGEEVKHWPRVSMIKDRLSNL